MTRPPRATGGRVQPHSHGALIAGGKHPGTRGTGPAGGKPVIDPNTLWPSGVVLGFVAIATEDKRQAIMVSLGADQPSLAGGISNWDAQERPKRRTISVYKGEVGWQITVPICFEGFKGKVSQERDCGLLEQMAVRRKGEKEPPKVMFDAGGAIPHDRTRDKSLRWIIGDLTWGAFATREEDADRIRQDAIVRFDQFTEDPLLAVGLGEQGKKYEHYTVKEGDTLKQIAKHKLGDARRWRELANINQVRDGNHLIAGTVILVPEK